MLELSEEQQGDFKMAKEKIIAKLTPLPFIDHLHR